MSCLPLGLLRRLEKPQAPPHGLANLPRPSSPRLPRLPRLPLCWQVLASKNSFGGDSSLGLQDGDECGEAALTPVPDTAGQGAPHQAGSPAARGPAREVGRGASASLGLLVPVLPGGTRPICCPWESRHVASNGALALFWGP